MRESQVISPSPTTAATTVDATDLETDAELESRVDINRFAGGGVAHPECLREDDLILVDDRNRQSGNAGRRKDRLGEIGQLLKHGVDAGLRDRAWTVSRLSGDWRRILRKDGMRSRCGHNSSSDSCRAAAKH